MQLSRKKLAKETSDFQVKFKELKASIQEIFSSYEQQVDEIRYLKGWSFKLNDLMVLQCQADIQEELDKQSISLVGYKEVPGSPMNEIGSRVSSPQN